VYETMILSLILYECESWSVSLSLSVSLLGKNVYWRRWRTRCWEEYRENRENYKMDSFI